MFLKTLFLQCFILSQLTAASQAITQDIGRSEGVSMDLSSVQASKERLQAKVQPIDENSFLKSVYKAQKNNSFLEYQFTQNAWPVIDFFKVADSISIDVWYGAFRAISNATKSCLYLRAGSLNNLLSAAEVYLVPYLEKYKAMNDEKMLELKLNKLVKARLSEGKNQSLDTLTTSLSKDIVKLYEKQKSEPIEQYISMVKDLFYNFADTAISKTVWEVNDYSTAWDSLLTTANYLYQMPSILETYDKLDNLINSLVHSFSRFIEFNYQNLPLSFLENIKSSIEQKEAFFLPDSEPDDFVVPKKELLMKKIDECIEKKKAKEVKPWQEESQFLALSQPMIKKESKLFENV